MNHMIYKYELNEHIAMPKGAQILHVAYQPILLKFFLWALIDPDNKDETRTFQLVGTGEKVIDNNLLVKPTHIGTCMAFKGGYLLHVFENVKLTNEKA